MLISCQCGTKLKVDPASVGKMVTCPKCKCTLKVPPPAFADQPATVVKKPAPVPTAKPPAPAGKATAPAGKATAPAQSADPSAMVTLACRCGQQMKVAAAHAGKTVACPKCSAQLTVPGAAAPTVPTVIPVQPVQPVQPQVVTPQAVAPQAVAPQAVASQQPDFFSSPAAPATGGMHPYTPPAAAAPRPRAPKKPSGQARAGQLVVMIGICIMAGGLLFSAVGQGMMHLLIYRATSMRSSASAFDFRSSTMEERRQELDRRRSMLESTQTMDKIMRIALKIGRTVLVIGTVTAAVGYGICIMSPGAQMGLAIGALVVGVLAAGLDLFMRVVPYLAENDIPRDMIRVRASIFDTGEAVVPLLIEVLMAVHLLLFAIYALVGVNRRSSGVGVPVTALVMFSVYIVLAFIISILMGSGGRMSSPTTVVWVAFGTHWVANICLAIGFGFMIGSIVELRKPAKRR